MGWVCIIQIVRGQIELLLAEERSEDRIYSLIPS
jgi:hypothetical protein